MKLLTNIADTITKMRAKFGNIAKIGEFLAELLLRWS